MVMDLVSDLLDKQVVDRNGREMGRVDAIVLEARPGKPPLVRAIEIGPEVLARRVHPALGRLASTLEEIAGVADRRPIRIPFTQVDMRHHVVADITAGETGAANVENRVRAFLRRFAWK
jgi:sporulation protein YlmC with PRC-barrel domain